MSNGTARPVPWWLGMLAPLDFESTGVDVRQARIVTGYTTVLLGRDQGRRSQAAPIRLIVDPGIPIPPEATAMHGVTDEMARQGFAAPDGVNTFAEEVARTLTARIPIVGFNLSYDLSLLYWECLRHGLPTVAERMGYPPAAAVGPIIDASVLDKHVDPYRKGPRKLTAVAGHYGVALTAAHTADADAMASVRVAVAIAERYGMDRDITGDAGALHQLQKGWAAEQRAGLQRHFRKTRPEAYVDPCWPLCTDPDHPSG